VTGFGLRNEWPRVSPPSSSLCRTNPKLTVKLLTVLKGFVFLSRPPAVRFALPFVPLLLSWFGRRGTEGGSTCLFWAGERQWGVLALGVEGEAQVDHDGGVRRGGGGTARD